MNLSLEQPLRRHDCRSPRPSQHLFGATPCADGSLCRERREQRCVPRPGFSTFCMRPRRGFQELHGLCDGWPFSTPHVVASLLARLDSTFEHVRGVADPGAVSRDGRHGHAPLVRPGQTFNARLISTDAAVMMNSSASATFGREIRRVCRCVRTANDDAAVGFRRKFSHAVNHNNRNVHAAVAPATTAILVFNKDILFPSSLGAGSAGLDGSLWLRPPSSRRRRRT